MDISRREYTLGEYRLSAEGRAAVEAPYIIAGPRLYAIGRGSGAIGPIGAEHLVGEMGGIWAHPLKVADGLTLALRDDQDDLLACTDGLFSESPQAIGWSWQAGDLRLARCDRVPPGAPAYAALVTVANEGSSARSGTLEVTAHLKFLGCWFGGIAAAGGSYAMADALVLGHDQAQPEWGIALGAKTIPDDFAIAPRERGAVVTLRYSFALEPGAVRAWQFLLCVSQDGGQSAAASRWREQIEQLDLLFANEEADFLDGLPRLRSEHPELARDTAMAQANLGLLQADYPESGAYFLAGLPEYPQLFGCDTTYSVPGAVASGFAATTRSAIVSLARYAERACGRVPHEITTNGRVFHPGNIQETPQFALAVWDYVRWTGDLELAQRLFPLLCEGVTRYVPAMGGPHVYYPIGDGMVERMGMGARKLDSACYQIAGRQALARLAAALGQGDAADYAAHADEANSAFERDWWLEDEGLYADSMHSDGRLQLDGHWTQVLPLQLGLAAPERAERVLARLEREFVNQWGLVHTRAHEELVWTLPTGLLALAAFQRGRAERGLELASKLALTARQGALGTFKELIPQGLCFIQLWSAGLYLQTIYEGLLGLRPDAPAHALSVEPCMPADLAPITLYGLRIGEHKLKLTLAAQTLELEHLEGPQALRVSYAGTSHNVAPTESLRQSVGERR